MNLEPLDPARSGGFVVLGPARPFDLRVLPGIGRTNAYRGARAGRGQCTDCPTSIIRHDGSRVQVLTSDRDEGHMGMSGTESVLMEAVFMIGPPDIVTFDGRVVKHYTPKDRVKYGAAGDPEWTIVPGEYAVIADVPSSFDLRVAWNRITVASLGGWREVTGTSAAGPGQIRVDLRRRSIPNP